MKRGHVTGHKKERSSKNANWWYELPEQQEYLRKLEAEWEAKQQEGLKQD
jgi:hypothetical protein